MKHIVKSLSALALITLAAACSKEDTPLPELSTATYTGSTLTMTYCGEAMPAKIVTFTPDASGASATLDMAGILDLSSLGIKTDGPLPAPGVIPGSATTTVKVALTPSDNGSYTFAGDGESDFATYSYSGELTAGHLTVNLTDVKLKVAALAGSVFKPAPLEASIADIAAGKEISSPFFIRWEIGNIPGLEINPGALLNALTLAPIVPVYNNTAYSSVAQIFEQCVKTMALLDNGNIPVRYFSSKEGATQLMTTSGNMLQYVVTSQNSIQLYINPMSAIALWLNAQSKPTWLPSFFDTAYADTIRHQIELDKVTPSEADEALRQAMVKALLTAIMPAMRDGLPMEFTPASDGINLYLDTATCSRFAATLLGDLMKQPAVMARLAALLKDMGVSEAQLTAMIGHLPEILQATTRFNIGLSLVKYQ